MSSWSDEPRLFAFVDRDLAYVFLRLTESDMAIAIAA